MFQLYEQRNSEISVILHFHVFTQFQSFILFCIKYILRRFHIRTLALRLFILPEECRGFLQSRVVSWLSCNQATKPSHGGLITLLRYILCNERYQQNLDLCKTQAKFLIFYLRFDKLTDVHNVKCKPITLRGQEFREPPFNSCLFVVSWMRNCKQVYSSQIMYFSFATFGKRVLMQKSSLCNKSFKNLCKISYLIHS